MLLLLLLIFIFYLFICSLWLLNAILLHYKKLNIAYKNLYIYIYISKNWSVAFIVALLQLSHISLYIIIFFLSNFPIIVFNIYFFNIFTFSTFLPSLPFHLSTTSPAFLPPLPFHLPTTLYINIILPFFLHLPLFLSFLIRTLYYKFVTISSILFIVLPHNKKALSLNVLLDFLFFLHLWFKLIKFYIL